MICTPTERDEIANLTETAEILREENRQLRELLLPDVAPQFGLTKGEWRIVSTLLRHSPISKERLYELVYWGRDNPPDPKGLQVLICRSRPKVAAAGIHIRTVRSWGYDIDWVNPDPQLRTKDTAAVNMRDALQF